MEARGGRGRAAARLRLRLRVALVSVVLMATAASVSRAQLQVGFYDTLCPAAEIIVQEEVSKAVSGNPGVAASLVRLHFHDCFVRGCDASVLVDSTPGNQAEKDAAPNTSLRGFEVIDSAKTRLEQACFGVVSCADVLALAARDALALVGANAYQVPTGRRDGNVSAAPETSGNLPPPTASVAQLNQIFGAKGLTQADMVALSGAHTIGNAHCSSFDSRLYSYGPNNAGQDPSMDPTYLAALTQQCPQQQQPAATARWPWTPSRPPPSTPTTTTPSSPSAACSPPTRRSSPTRPPPRRSSGTPTAPTRSRRTSPPPWSRWAPSACSPAPSGPTAGCPTDPSVDRRTRAECAVSIGSARRVIGIERMYVRCTSVGLMSDSVVPIDL